MRKGKNAKTSGVFFISLALVASVILQLLPNAAIAAEEKTAVPDTAHCVVYHYDSVYNAVSNPDPQTPMLYMWGMMEDAAVRVYASAGSAEPIGTARRQSRGQYCAVALDGGQMNRAGGTLYVTRQAEGKAESDRVPVTYGAAGTPSVSFDVREFRGTSAGYIHAGSGYQGMRVASPGKLKQDTVYVANVVLKEFGPVQSLILPIKYDPEVWQLVRLDGELVQESYRY